MVDLIDRVTEDRGILSRIQAFIPGFKGYRINEDIRAADNMLRAQLAERLGAVRNEVEGCRSVMVANYSLEHLERLGVLINRFKTVEQEVLHAEQGYSGISARIKVDDKALTRLYDYDYSLASKLAEMGADAAKLKMAAGMDNRPLIKENIDAMGVRIDSFEADFRNRMRVATDTGV